MSVAKSNPTLPIEGHDHIQGSIKAPVALVEYGDYECPYCGQAYPIVKAVQKRLGNRLCFAFRNFPLANMHPHAEHAAEAAEAAAAQGRFWEMHDLLYENQVALDDADLEEYASTLGLDSQRLMEEVRSGAHTARIREDFRGGARNGVNGTPTFFINGERYDGELSEEALLEALGESDE
ncbi:MAG TPA: DsbA family protein [Verrucomicrobiae bacterium]|nr:DsbA family protein [Verrucomicrobiae bacterium]